MTPTEARECKFCDISECKLRAFYNNGVYGHYPCVLLDGEYCPDFTPKDKPKTEK